jgi:hypothetical protein
MTTDSNTHLTHLDESGNIHMVDVTDRPSPKEKSLSSGLYPGLPSWGTPRYRSVTANLTATAEWSAPRKSIPTIH